MVPARNDLLIIVGDRNSPHAATYNSTRHIVGRISAAVKFSNNDLVGRCLSNRPALLASICFGKPNRYLLDLCCNYGDVNRPHPYSGHVGLGRFGAVGCTEARRQAALRAQTTASIAGVLKSLRAPITQNVATSLDSRWWPERFVSLQNRFDDHLETSTQNPDPAWQSLTSISS